MKKKIYLLIGALSTMYSTINGQNISGIVLDKTSKNSLENVEVFIPEYGLLTETNSNGVFTFTLLPEKKTVIQLEKKGYEQLIDTVELNSLQDTFYLSKSHVELDEFIVSIPGGSLQKNSVVSVERLNAKQMNMNAPLNTADALKGLNGVNVISTGASIGKPVIRGLSGNRVVVYAQGIRVENLQFGGEHGIGVGLIGLDGIEVIKGPNSLLYGSDAIGGVLYFEDAKFAKENSHEAYIKQSFQSNSLMWRTEAGAKLNYKKIKFNVFGNYGKAADYQLPDGDRAFNTRFTTGNIKSALGYQHKNWFSTLRYAYLQNGFGITESDSTIATDKSYQLSYPQQFVNEHRLSWENSWYIKQSKLKAILGYTNNQRKEIEQEVGITALHMIVQNYSWNITYQTDVNKKMNAIFGTQGAYQMITNWGEETVIPDADIYDAGIFGIVNYNFKRLKVQGGVRLDNRILDAHLMEGMENPEAAKKYEFSAINYSLGSKYDISEKIDAKINISTGFRAPNIAELTAYGVHEGTNQFNIGKYELKKEQAQQIDLTLSWNSEHLQFSVNPFVNSINNYIYLSYQDSTIDGSPVFAYEQADALLYGGEAGLHWHPHQLDWLHLKTMYNMTYGQYKTEGYLPMMPSSKFIQTVKAELPANKIKIHNIYVNYTYSFKQERLGKNESLTPAYNLLDAGIQFKSVVNHLDIDLVAKNILNELYIDNLSRFKQIGLAAPGFNLALQLKCNLF